ncbi:MAG: VWA domain-containing protein, partial [Acidobacteriota bacterium]
QDKGHGGSVGRVGIAAALAALAGASALLGPILLRMDLRTDMRQLEAGIGRVDAIGGTAMRDAVDAAVDYLTAHATRDRHALLVVTDGQDNASVTSLDRVRRKVARSDAVIYAIGLLAGESGPQAARAREELEECAERTGGRALFPERLDNIDATVLDIAHQIRSQYTIAYAPQNQALDGSYRKIRVDARGHGRLSVRTRSGYLASRDSGAATPRLSNRGR